MYLVGILTILSIGSSLAANITEDSNKTKRNIAGQIHNYGDNRPVLLYPDSYAPGPIKPVFEPEVPKQVAAQQVLYEFQQTPTNAFSNVHVNQYYQPVPQHAQPNKPEPQMNPPLISSSESVATPVQHSSLIRHGQNFAQVQFQPLPGTPQHIQTHQYIPGKYLYVNGKIIYQPSQPNQPNVPQNPIVQRPANFVYNHPQTHTQKFITPIVRPVAYRRFNPPQPHQIQQITKPMNVPEVTEEQNEEEAPEEETQTKEEDVEEEDEDKTSYEEDEGDEDRYYNKYAFEDEDEEHLEDDDDADNERGSSKTVKKHTKNSKPQKHKTSNFKYSESYSSKYDKPSRKVKKTSKAPKAQHKAVSYRKEGHGKPREKIEGKQSQNVPVIHKQKIFKEKWYVTKSTDGSTAN